MALTVLCWMFLKISKERVVLNGQHSSWSDVVAGVPQGSILGQLLFLIYINDLSDGLQSNPKLFADDTITIFDSSRYYRNHKWSK